MLQEVDTKVEARGFFFGGPLPPGCANARGKPRPENQNRRDLEGGEENQVSSAIKFSDSKARYDYCGVPIGFHTKEVLKEINFSDAEIESMINNNEIQ